MKHVRIFFCILFRYKFNLKISNIQIFILITFKKNIFRFIVYKNWANNLIPNLFKYEWWNELNLRYNDNNII